MTIAVIATKLIPTSNQGNNQNQETDEMTMMQARYEENEASILHKQLQKAEDLKSQDAKEAERDALELMKESNIVQLHLTWMFNGDYGYGAMRQAESIRDAHGRTNKELRLIQLLCALDCNTSRARTIRAWKQLYCVQKHMLSLAIRTAIAMSKEDENGPS